MTLSLNDPAREWLNKLINKDGQFRDLSSKIAFSRDDFASVSGVLDTDYAFPRINVGGQLEFEKTTPIPPELFERLGRVKQCCRMGVFPQCRKAWLTVDSEFFTWNFEDGEDLAFYDGCQDVIISVCLFRPKLGILPAAIEYLLVLATPGSLVVLGVTYDFTISQDGYCSSGLLNVLPTPLYWLSTNNNYVTCIEGTSNGRLFMGNREGNLLEFTYGPIPSLDNNLSDLNLSPSDNCSLVNHTASSLNFILPTILTSGFRPSGAITQISVDSRRGLLWTLTENSHLAVYQYDVAGVKATTNYLTKLASLTGSDVSSRASSVVKSIDRSNFSKIISICALSEDGGPIHMLAVTATGIRIYFTNNLRIVHVRLPPRNTSVANFGEPSVASHQNSPPHMFALGDVKLVVETRGTVIFASSIPQASTDPSTQQADTLTLSVASPDPFPWSPCLSETITTSLCVESPWTMTMIPSEGPSSTSQPGNPDVYSSVSSASFNKKGIELPHESGLPQSDPHHPAATASPASGSVRPPTPKGSPPVMLTQHLDPHYRRLLVITAHGIVHLRLPTPLQRLRDFFATSAISASSSVENIDGGFLSAYLHQFGPDESICAAISIAAAEQANSEMVEQAERTVIYFATEAARFWQPPVISHVTAVPATPTSPSDLHFHAITQQDATADTFLVLGASLFLSRVARTVWRAPMLVVADLVPSGVGTGGQSTSVSGGLKSLFYTLVTTVIAKASAGGGSAKDSMVVTSRLSSDDIGWILHQLRYLRTLLESSHQKASVASHSLAHRVVTHDSPISPLTRLLQDICALLSAFIEFVGLWQIVSQHNVPAISSHLSEEHRNDLLNLPVEAFVCWMPRTAAVPTPASAAAAPLPLHHTHSPPPPTTTDIRSALIAALFEHYLSGESQTGSVDALCSRLRSVCPNLFGNEDALCARAEELLVRAAAIPMELVDQRETLIAEAVELLQSAGPALNLGLAAARLGGTVGAWHSAVALCLSFAQLRDPMGVALACLRDSRQPESTTMGKTTQSEVQIVESRYDAYRHLLECLNRLLAISNIPASSSRIPQGEQDVSQQYRQYQCIGPNPTCETARQTLLSILNFIVKSEDVLAHFEVIGWLLSNGLIEQVVSLDSPHLEAYLQSRLRQFPNDISLRKLLWRQLESRGARLEAAQVLEHLATSPATGSERERLTLEDRLDYLARAVITVKALPQSLLADSADYLADLQDRLDMAELQQQLCVELTATSSASSDPAVEEAFAELTQGPLLPASELFNSYADPFDLHESKLMLLHFAGEADSDLVEAIWTALLHRILLSANAPASSLISGSPASQRRRLSAAHRKTARGLELAVSGCLNRLYVRLALVANSPVNSAHHAIVVGTPVTVDYSFFPLTVIISTLERYGIQQALPTNWVPNIFTDAKIPSSPEVVEAYNVILCKKDPFWVREAVRSRLMEVICFFVSNFIDTANRLPPRQRQLQASRMLDHLTTHLVELHAEPKTGGGDLGLCGSQGQHQPHAVLAETLRGLRRRLDRVVATCQ
uniref:Nucleoporin_N domain-containing protein n=2 Tax=Mesocestoides corti TaxID=53468 RepID=A0A5K3FHU6_MESCO